MSRFEEKFRSAKTRQRLAKLIASERTDLTPDQVIAAVEELVEEIIETHREHKPKHEARQPHPLTMAGRK